MSVTGEPDGRPLKAGTAVVDLVCGLLAANGIQAALVERARTGAGRHVEVSLMDSALTLPAQPGHGVGRRGRARPAGAATATRASCPTRRTRPPTARWRSRSATSASSRGCATRSASVGCPATSASRPTRRASRTPTSSPRRSRRCCATRAAEHWLAILREAKVPAGPINEVDEAFGLAEELGMEPVEELDGLPLIRPPLRIDGARPPIRRPPPRLDEHGGDLRSWLQN